MQADKNTLDIAVERFAPVYVFHPSERYFPLRFPTFVAGCSLQKVNAETGKTETLKSYPNVTVEDLINPDIDAGLNVDNAVTRGPSSSIFLEIKDVHMVYGTITGPEQAIHYVYVSTVVVDETTLYLDLLFNLLYGFNCMSGDDHAFDSEYVVVRVLVTENEMVLKSMWTSRHGGGGWYTKSELSFVDDTHPISYVALGSHANYNSPGLHRRMWGFGNDICASNAATVFRPAYLIVPKPGDADFPGDATVNYMAYPGLTSSIGSGSYLMAWKPRFLDTIQTPPEKASDDTSRFIKKQVPNIGDITFYSVVCLLLLVVVLECVILATNTKSIGNATWQQLLILSLTFIAGIFATDAHLLL